MDQILDATESGDAVVSDCSLHPLVPELPFGGVGNSGMGSTTEDGASSPCSERCRSLYRWRARPRYRQPRDDAELLDLLALLAPR